MASQTFRTGTPGLDRVDRAAPAERGEDVVAGHALGAHRAELPIEPGPELLQAHGSTLTRRAARAYRYRHGPRNRVGGFDLVLQIGIALAMSC